MARIDSTRDVTEKNDEQAYRTDSSEGDSRSTDHNRRPTVPGRSGGDNFHETMSSSVPNRTYRSDIDAVGTSPLEQIIRAVATILGLLLVARFLVSLFDASRSNPIAGLVYSLTDWMARPFAPLFSATPIGNGALDWPAVAAFVSLAVLAGILLGLIRSHRRHA